MKFIAQGPYPSEAPTAPTPAGSWLIPAPASGFGSWASRGTVHGQPGTEPVTAPRPAAVSQDASHGVTRHRSSDSPDLIYPALYFEVIEENPAIVPTGRVMIVSDNMMPMPAIDPRGLPAVMATKPPRLGGQGQVSQPYAVQNWPKWVQTS
jgi:hypothetical protein